MAERKRFEAIDNNECPSCGSLIVYESVQFSDGQGKIKAVCTNCSFWKWIPDYKENKNAREDRRLDKWAHDVKKRDNNICKVCGSSEKIEAHHIIPVSICKRLPFSEEIAIVFNQNNGITLCKRCHDLSHGKLVGYYEFQ